MKKRLKLLGHSVFGLLILAGVGALAAISLDGFLGQLAKAIVAAQAFLALGAVNLYVMVKTPMRDVISENADALVLAEEKWKAGKLSQAGGSFALAAAIEAVGRVLSIMLFAGLGMAFAVQAIVSL